MMQNEISKASLRPEREACREHPEEEVNYFCFQCMCPPVCSECVVHGAHRSHDVLTLKKALPVVTARLEDLVLQVSARIDDMNVLEQRLEARKRDIADQTSTLKQQMANSFEELRQRLEKKERELMANADGYMEQHVKEVDMHMRLLRGRASALSSTIETIREQHRQQEESRVLDFFALNYAKIVDGIESELPQLQDIQSQQVHITVNGVNKHSLNRFIEDMQGLQLEIANMRTEVEGPSLRTGKENLKAQMRSEERSIGGNAPTVQMRNAAEGYSLREERSAGLAGRETKQTREGGPKLGIGIGGRSAAGGASLFEIAYRNKNPLRASVAQTINRIHESSANSRLMNRKPHEENKHESEDDF